jgi:hypothetical protein
MPPTAARFSAAVLAALSILSIASIAQAQDSKSSPLAKQLTAALEAAKLDSIAAKDPTAPDTYVAALYYAGSPLLVVSAKYSVPQLLDARLGKKEFRDAYIDLSSASIPETKIFIQDAGGDGIKARREDGQAFDSYEVGGKPTMFDGDFKRQKLSEQDYQKVYTSADERYSAMLAALLSQLKPQS